MINTGFDVSSNQLLPQFNNLRLMGVLPTTIPVSIPDYNVIVTNPATGLTSSVSMITTQVGNLTYSVPPSAVSNSVQFGIPLSSAREIPTSYINVDPYTQQRSNNNPIQENNSPLEDINYEDNNSTASDGRSHHSNAHTRIDVKKELRHIMKKSKPRTFSG